MSIPNDPVQKMMNVGVTIQGNKLIIGPKNNDNNNKILTLRNSFFAKLFYKTIKLELKDKNTVTVTTVYIDKKSADAFILGERDNLSESENLPYEKKFNSAMDKAQAQAQWVFFSNLDPQQQNEYLANFNSNDLSTLFNLVLNAAENDGNNECIKNLLNKIKNQIGDLEHEKNTNSFIEIFNKLAEKKPQLAKDFALLFDFNEINPKTTAQILEKLTRGELQFMRAVFEKCQENNQKFEIFCQMSDNAGKSKFVNSIPAMTFADIYKAKCDPEFMKNPQDQDNEKLSEFVLSLNSDKWMEVLANLNMDEETKNKFLDTKNLDGQNYFHKFMSERQNLQSTSIEGIKKLNLLPHLLVGDSKGTTAFDLAYQKGQMAVINEFFPIPDNKTKTIVTDVAGIKNATLFLVETLSTKESRENHLSSCPGNNFDSLNHIMSGIMHVCYHSEVIYKSMQDKIKELKLKNENIDIPVELQSFEGLEHSAFKEIIEGHIKEVEDIKVENIYEINDLEKLNGLKEAISQKMEAWEILGSESEELHKNIMAENDPIKKMSLFILSSFKLKSNQLVEKPWINRIFGKIFHRPTDKDQERFSDQYRPDDVLKSFRYVLNTNLAYDHYDLSKLTRAGDESVAVSLVRETLTNENVDLAVCLEIIKQLTYKCPDFLNDKCMEAIKKILPADPRNHRAMEILHALNDFKQKLPAILLEKRIKKTLKFSLEQKGRNIQDQMINIKNKLQDQKKEV